MYVSDTEDDREISCPSTFDHVLDVSPEALAKVFILDWFSNWCLRIREMKSVKDYIQELSLKFTF